MKFVKADELKLGMRLAKPIYNKKGVLLYERNSKLTQQGIESVKNFGLIGIYILEPAEPLPPMTDDDIEFEKFQSVSVFTIKDELQGLIKNGKQTKIYPFADSIIKSYGRLDHKINFVQNLRSNDDFIYKHSLNVAILCALICHKMNLRPDEQRDTVIAAVIHAIGLLNVPEELSKKQELTGEEKKARFGYELSGMSIVEEAFLSSPNIKRIAQAAIRHKMSVETGEEAAAGKIPAGSKVLIVADAYDSMTAMNVAGETPFSEIAALKNLMNNPEIYDKDVVDALIGSINFLAEGCSVELSNGEKALVVSSNDRNILRPMVLLFSTNKLVDLAQTAFYGDIEIEDIMKTLDNRYVIDSDAVKRFKGE